MLNNWKAKYQQKIAALQKKDEKKADLRKSKEKLIEEGEEKDQQPRVAAEDIEKQQKNNTEDRKKA